MTMIPAAGAARLKLRATPGRVFLRLEGNGPFLPYLELTAAEALRAAEALTELAREALRPVDDPLPLPVS